MAEAADRDMSWKSVPCLNESYMMHICWIWQVLVPLYRPAITREIAAELWMIFRAKCIVATHDPEHEGPVDLPMEVQTVRHWANELWLLHIQAN